MRASRPHSSDTLAPGQRIGPFVLLAPMGVGGSGRIWAVARVGQLGFNKRMVLKVMRHDKLSSERARERFDREACLGGRLSHPNVRAVHDLGSHEGRPFMAMSWVDTSLVELLEHAPGRALEADVVCWIGMQCCSALSAAHGFVDHDGEPRPIVHRDVSPGNILLTVDGHALLADLTAPADDAAASPRLDASTRFFGSLGYAAPEALRQAPLDGRADLFSLGAVLFEALTGSPAFEGDDERSVVFQILEGPTPELARRVPGVADDLAAVIARCLERRPEARFQTAAELGAALSACCRQQSAFRLELRAAALVREVLGARIREREEALHLAFQCFAPSPFERTDTLPIVSASGAPRDPGGTLDISTLDALPGPRDSERDASPSGAGVALTRRKTTRRGPLWVAVALAALFLAYGLCSVQLDPAQPAGANGTAVEKAARSASAGKPEGAASSRPRSEDMPGAGSRAAAADASAGEAAAGGVVAAGVVAAGVVAAGGRDEAPASPRTLTPVDTPRRATLPAAPPATPGRQPAPKTRSGPAPSRNASAPAATARPAPPAARPAPPSAPSHEDFQYDTTNPYARRRAASAQGVAPVVPR